MITKIDIINTWAWVRKNNHSIPDEVLDFMKAASLQELSSEQPSIQKGEDYWKRRCEAAEKVISTYNEWHDYNSQDRSNKYGEYLSVKEQWQNLKNEENTIIQK